MGEDVPDRRAFIEKYAKEVTILTSEENNEPVSSNENILNHSLVEEMKTSYINYAMSVIIGRAYPTFEMGLNRSIDVYYMGCTKEDIPLKRSTANRLVRLEVMGKYRPSWRFYRSMIPWSEWHKISH